MPKGKVFVVGVGPGSAGWVSAHVRDLVLSADILVGWEQDFKPVKNLVKSQQIYLQECHNYLEIPGKAALEAETSGATVVVLKTGDPLVAPAGLEGVLKTFEGFDISIVPGISTVQLAAAKAGVSLTDSAIITYHPLPHDGGSDLRKKRKRILKAIENGLHVIVLTGVRQMPRQTAQFLIDQGIDPSTACIVFENLGLPEERFTNGCLNEVVSQSFNWKSVMIIL
ncbi:precorrin-6y C5,15-methyltransferase (decarboxylating) subunit CbiE [Dehalogenimonas sp. THU2]|uniref:precorrin-6y C5,15-methyltransferase (decarboxylating) subunit CbiE n=1 Tax=Dehalogenimonas sp. THU2 TaxID=3151121 RepID=UPI003218A2D5